MRPLLAALLVALAAGCGAESEKGGEAGEGERPSAVPKIEAAEFYRDYSSLKGAERLKKYSAGVVVSGTVKETVELGKDEGYQLRLATGGQGHIAVKFRDGGAEASKLKIQPGEPVTVECQINGKPDAILFLVDCELRRD